MINAAVATREEILHVGITALVQALGPEGVIRFLQQYSNGLGDYTRERQTLLPEKTVAELGDRILQEQSQYP